jgi:hypothetical protein
MKTTSAAIATVLLLLTATPASVGALTLPDSGSCSSTSPCLQVTSTATSIASYAFGATSSSGIGLRADGPQYGIIASTSNGTGVVGEALFGGVGATGISGSNNGVRGYTSSGTAAAISAISPSSTGLAYWGTGGIQISGSFAQKAGGGSWSSPSDARIKKDVKDLRWSLDELMQVRPVTFKYNGRGGSDDDGREHIGVIAQELERIFPGMVTSRKAKLDKNDAKESDIRVVDPSAFTYVLINAVQDQQQIIERQEKRIPALERARTPLGATVLGGGVGTALAAALLPLAIVAVRRRKKSEA